MVEERNESSGYSTTDEYEHSHYCEMCGGIWTHDDEVCVGPRWTGRMVFASSWDCPRCEESGR